LEIIDSELLPNSELECVRVMMYPMKTLLGIVYQVH